jgi:hypothetical protein
LRPRNPDPFIAQAKAPESRPGLAVIWTAQRMIRKSVQRFSEKIMRQTKR